MAARIVLPPTNPSLDANGNVAIGSTLHFYENGTTTLKTIYSTADLTTPLSNPLTCDSAGRFPPMEDAQEIWCADDAVYSVKWSVPGESPITFNNIRGVPSPLADDRNAYYTNVQATPTGSGSNVMMGLGASWKLTPNSTGRVRLKVIGTTRNDTADKVTEVRPRYGTGSPPANGAAPTGTSMGSTTRNPGHGVSVSISTNFHYFAVVTGLSLGTERWFDLEISSGLGGVSTITVEQIEIEEF